MDKKYKRRELINERVNPQTNEQMDECNYKPSPGYAGVSLSLAKTELNARGLHRTVGLRLNQLICLEGCGQGDPSYFGLSGLRALSRN